MGVALFGQKHGDRYRESDGAQGHDWQATTVGPDRRPAAISTGKTALSIRACLASQRVQFATATEWVARLSEAKRQGSLEAEPAAVVVHPALHRLTGPIDRALKVRRAWNRGRTSRT